MPDAGMHAIVLTQVAEVLLFTWKTWSESLTTIISFSLGQAMVGIWELNQHMATLSLKLKINGEGRNQDPSRNCSSIVCSRHPGALFTLSS